MIDIDQLRLKRISPTIKFLNEIEKHIIYYDYQDRRKVTMNIPETGIDVDKVIKTVRKAGYKVKHMNKGQGLGSEYLTITWE